MYRRRRGTDSAEYRRLSICQVLKASLDGEAVVGMNDGGDVDCHCLGDT
jgi:hypothetical protein